MNFDFMDEKRKEERFTVTLFCQELGIDESTYYYWKSDPERLENAKHSTIMKIMELLKMSAKEKKIFLEQ